MATADAATRTVRGSTSVTRNSRGRIIPMKIHPAPRAARPLASAISAAIPPKAGVSAKAIGSASARTGTATIPFVTREVANTLPRLRADIRATRWLPLSPQPSSMITPAVLPRD